MLVVDDEQDTLEIVSLLLRRYGATVRTTLSSGDAFEVFNEWKPSVLISDLGMPGEDGYSLISKGQGPASRSRGRNASPRLNCLRKGRGSAAHYCSRLRDAFEEAG